MFGSRQRKLDNYEEIRIKQLDNQVIAGLNALEHALALIEEQLTKLNEVTYWGFKFYLNSDLDEKAEQERLLKAANTWPENGRNKENFVRAAAKYKDVCNLFNTYLTQADYPVSRMRDFKEKSAVLEQVFNSKYKKHLDFINIIFSGEYAKLLDSDKIEKSSISLKS